MLKYFIIFFFVLFYENSYAFQYLCEFIKKVDSMSDFQTSEIENSKFEENQNLLKIVNKSLTMIIYDREIKHIINLEKSKSVINYLKINEDENRIVSYSKKGNFFMFFDLKLNNLIFSEYHDATHVSDYFYSCTKR